MVPYVGPYIICVLPLVVPGVEWAVQGLHTKNVPLIHNSSKNTRYPGCKPYGTTKIGSVGHFTMILMGREMTIHSSA